LRGKRVDEALEQLDRHLDRAVLAGAPWVNVIHGHGTGAMKKAVRDLLAAHPQVASFRPGAQGEGGDGVTVVQLA
jgi:DNA mismatch repair protein MutS2